MRSKKPEHKLKLFIRFALAKGAVTWGLELMLAVLSIVQRHSAHYYYLIGQLRHEHAYRCLRS